MKTNEELLKENAELRASVYALRICVQNAVMNTNSLIDVAPIINTYNKTPVQHLADIKLSAQEEFTSMMRDDLRKHIAKASGTVDADFLISLKFTDRMVQEYANKLRGEAK